MLVFISIFIISSFSLFLWMILIVSSKSRSDEEEFIEDNLQMKYLKGFCSDKRKFNKFM